MIIYDCTVKHWLKVYFRAECAFCPYDLKNEILRLTLVKRATYGVWTEDSIYTGISTMRANGQTSVAEQFKSGMLCLRTKSKNHAILNIGNNKVKSNKS